MDTKKILIQISYVDPNNGEVASFSEDIDYDSFMSMHTYHGGRISARIYDHIKEHENDDGN